MKKSLAHLPKQKQTELMVIKDIILDKIPDVRMLVLFGSYARGNWVEDIHTEGHYFFTDIKKEGIHLYKTSKHNLGKAKILTPQERKQIAQEDFKQWFKNAKEFYIGYETYLQKRMYKKAAFMLHQAVESFYSAITLVFVNYRFRTHDIELLGIKAVSYNDEFAKVFPQ